MKLKDQVTLRRTAKEVRKVALWIRVAAIACTGLLLVVGTVYALAYFYDKMGSFTVRLDKYDMAMQGLSLSETPDFDTGRARLDADAMVNMYNISGHDLPADIDDIDGEHNGENYIAYTFYLKNSGKDTVSYHYSIKMENVTKGIDEAVRIRLYVNGEEATYAKKKKDGTGPEPETEAFLSDATVLAKDRKLFEPGGLDKFTVVIWLEGDDPECVDDIIGGQMKLEMNYTISEEHASK